MEVLLSGLFSRSPVRDEPVPLCQGGRGKSSVVPSRPDVCDRDPTVALISQRKMDSLSDALALIHLWGFLYDPIPPQLSLRPPSASGLRPVDLNSGRLRGRWRPAVGRLRDRTAGVVSLKANQKKPVAGTRI